MAEQAVVLADNLFMAVAHGVEKVLVGLDHLALRGELDHRHGAADGIDQAFALMFVLDPPGDVRRHFDHAGDLLLGPEHRHVAGFKPELTTLVINSGKRTTLWLTAGQISPQAPIIVAVGVPLFTENPVVLAANLLKAVAHGLAEVVVGFKNDAVRAELDHRHGAADGGQFGIDPG
ncbi:hypothetical protein D3C78_865160 [compost metagenome]